MERRSEALRRVDAPRSRALDVLLCRRRGCNDDAAAMSTCTPEQTRDLRGSTFMALELLRSARHAGRSVDLARPELHE